MRNTLIIMLLAGLLVFSNCKKDDKDEPEDRFTLLTAPTWVADSLLADGIDASGPGQVLEKFKGEANFNVDGTGKFGEYIGTWKFQSAETELVIETDAHPIPITTSIKELTKTSLKVTTIFPDFQNNAIYDIRMTFKVK